MASTAITQVLIHEPWHTTRLSEPVRFGLPFAQGVIHDPAQIALEIAGRPVPVQTRALSRWPDGSVRWALIDFLADLDLRESIAATARRRDGEPPEPAAVVTVSDTGGRTIVDTGALTFDLSALKLTIGEHEVGMRLSIHEERLGELEIGAGSVRVLTAGPLVAEVVIECPCSAHGRHVLDARLLFRFFAGKAHIHAEVAVFSREQDLNLTQIRATVTPTQQPASELRAHTSMKRAQVGPAELVYNYPVEARSDPIYYEDSPDPCWVLWRAGWGARLCVGEPYAPTHGRAGGVMATIRNADHHFPTRLAATPDGIEIDLRPPNEEPLHLYPWMGKSYEVLVSLVPPEKTGYELTLDSALFQRPVRPVCSPEYYAVCGAFGDIFPTSRKYAGFEGLISTALRERSLGVGAMHFGDEPNLGYTYDDRGHGELVWTNCEYDTPRMLIMQYARTSNRAWFESADAAARHLMDIDFLRNSDNPRWAGGICCHEGDHRVAAYAGPSHEWCEGLIDYHHLTGCERALETALSVGDNVCRYIEDGEFDRVGAYALRELGWALTAIAACLRATNDDRYRQTGLRAIRILQEWVDTFGGLKDVNRFVEPGREDEITPIAVQRDAFISLTLNGVNRFYMASGEDEARTLFLDEVRAQLDWFNGPDGWAEQRETKIPNVEAFGYGFKYTGDRAYLDAGLRILEYALNNCMLRYYNMTRHVLDTSRSCPAAYRFSEVHAINSQILGLALIPMFSFLQTAEDAGELEKVIS